MSDIYHIFGYDLTVSSDGDLDLATGSDIGKQRVTRRLATNPGDYIFSLDYGAGLPARIGNTDTLSDISAVILQQMKLETSISQSPTPVVEMSDLGYGNRKINIKYSDADTDQTVYLEL
ncbi:phage tail protein [Acetobacter conturbans]|uniref:Phage tail protein n=1 Tax=Acetobacter conturbans TaxID=1737472 RepID=A0ABX0K1R5_9PROT|nr:phage tail protein [Acetobacter conturbans]NHN89190.1 phage tail protein [Acetobacter conturbans]